MQWPEEARGGSCNDQHTSETSSSMQHAKHADKFHAHAAINSHAVCWQKYGFRQVPLKQVVI